jgi:uncharacterized integral membrane protein
MVRACMATDSRTEFHSVSDALKHTGRIWMVWILVALRVADFGFIYFAWHAQNPIALLKGVVGGSVLWTTVLIVCVWQRRAWARYFLIAVIVGTIALFALAIVRLLNDHVKNDAAMLQAGGAAILVYALCAVPLARSRAILRLSTTLGGVQR